ncbi:hypothetical protein LJB83_03030 [Clostridia bacterium OttesenSCG-928-F22]|nr:hypothetical protein [Clostridia bacterium OttesenSCG-928-F22]
MLEPTYDALKHLSSFFHKTPLYLVGGANRNRLLFLPESDFDICSALKPQEVVQLFQHNNAVRVIETAPEFGTVLVLFAYKGVNYQFEHTTFRKDVYPEGGGHKPEDISFVADIRQDAQRRDFTINAVYMDCATGHMIDPLGGLQDLRAMRLNCCKEPAQTLGDDGVRILRMMRFACELNFTIDAELFRTAKANIGYLADISKERLQQELSKILLSDARYENGSLCGVNACLRGVLMLREIGALPYLFTDIPLQRYTKQYLHALATLPLLQNPPISAPLPRQKSC